MDYTKLLKAVDDLEQSLPRLKEIARGQHSMLDIPRAIGMLRTRASDVIEQLEVINEPE